MEKDYNELLYTQVATEYVDFIEKLKGMSPEEIISHSYEKVMKEDIVASFECKTLSQNEAKALCSKKYPLDFVYQEWLKNDYSHMEMIESTIDDSATKAVKERKDKQLESR